jgi:MoaA/NifB/PqqE/SkfB family radical SAM enzyme
MSKVYRAMDAWLEKDTAFVAHGGDVYGCGFLPISARNLKKTRCKNILNDETVYRLAKSESN